MRSIENKTTIFLVGLVLIMSIGFNACSEDEYTVDVNPKSLEEYKTELSDLVSSEKAVVENIVKGYNIGEIYTSDSLLEVLKSDYMDSLLLAEEILAQPDLTIADIIYANQALTSPGNDFNARIWTSDRRPLNEVIVFSDSLRAETPVGNFFGQCPAEDDSIFGLAISRAVYWRNLSTTLERQVAVEVDTLNYKLEIYKAAIIQ